MNSKPLPLKITKCMKWLFLVLSIVSPFFFLPALMSVRDNSADGILVMMFLMPMILISIATIAGITQIILERAYTKKQPSQRVSNNKMMRDGLILILVIIGLLFISMLLPLLRV